MYINLQDISIKRVTICDVDEMILHRVNYLTEMQGVHDITSQEKLKAELKVFIKNGIEGNNFIALVAKYKHITLSYGAIILKAIPGDFNCSSYLEGDILNMYTIPEARKQGISSLILKQLIAEAKLLGVSKLALYTSLAGEKLYRSAGFKNPEFPFLEMNL
jgi:GNAT superfamily N-acetyltransferase